MPLDLIYFKAFFGSQYLNCSPVLFLSISENSETIVFMYFNFQGLYLIMKIFLLFSNIHLHHLRNVPGLLTKDRQPHQINQY